MTPLLVWVYFRCPSTLLGCPVPPDSWWLHLFSFSQVPLPQGLFGHFWLNGTLPWKVPNSRYHQCYSWNPISRPRRHKPIRISPFPFPTSITIPTALILKRHFWKVGHKLWQATPALNHSCLSKQDDFAWQHSWKLWFLSLKPKLTHKINLPCPREWGS